MTLLNMFNEIEHRLQLIDTTVGEINTSRTNKIGLLNILHHQIEQDEKRLISLASEISQLEIEKNKLTNVFHI